LNGVRPLRVGLATCLEDSAPEIKYALRTLLRLAGYSYDFVWAGATVDSPSLDVYYGPPQPNLSTSVWIPAVGIPLTSASQVTLQGISERAGLQYADFGLAIPLDNAPTNDFAFADDIVFATYWLLSGARESHYRRDKRDNIELGDATPAMQKLLERPLVSMWSTVLRRYFCSRGMRGLELPWVKGGARAVFAFSHDVDYPQMIVWLECLRLLRSRGFSAWPLIQKVLRGNSNFWRFKDWVELEQRLAARGAFYFMARKGSLTQYALGTPDAFYDIRSTAFTRLFGELNDAGCEIGLHASYHSHKSGAQIEHERSALAAASKSDIVGNRNHYWHLDPREPHETLQLLAEAGLAYDSSLAFEFYPGFRRGICHPYRVFHPGRRRELAILEVPPAWMDDHFDRRLQRNGISQPDTYAAQLLNAARTTAGTIVIDYHVRGMNSDFFPRYGPWLTDFLQEHLDSEFAFRTPREIAKEYAEYEGRLETNSRDCAETGRPLQTRAPKRAFDVSLLQPGDFADWTSFVSAHPDANVYHTLAWKQVTEEGLGHRPYYLLARDTNGQVAGVLPLFLITGIFGRRLVSVPMRDRGGIVARDAAVVHALLDQAIAMSRDLKCAYVELRSTMGVDEQIAEQLGLRTDRGWIATRIDLSSGVEALWKDLPKDAVRRPIRNAREAGVHIQKDATLEGMETFYELFARTRTSMGIPPFPKAFFLAMWRHLVSTGQATLFIVRHHERPINALLGFASKDTFIGGYAAPQDAPQKCWPSEAAIWHTIEWAAHSGFRYVDLGADSQLQTGLLWFKKKWGGTQHPMFYQYHVNQGYEAPNFDSSSPTYNALRRVWRQFPMPMSRAFGSWVTTQLS
jgi:FemAB-related protein (PEP-CTERM system-associated)